MLKARTRRDRTIFITLTPSLDTTFAGFPVVWGIFRSVEARCKEIRLIVEWTRETPNNVSGGGGLAVEA